MRDIRSNAIFQKARRETSAPAGPTWPGLAVAARYTVALLVCLGAVPALADYAYMDTVYQFHDSLEYLPAQGHPTEFTVRAHRQTNWEVYNSFWPDPNGMAHIQGPYGGTWNGVIIYPGGTPDSVVANPWVAMGYPYSFAAQNPSLPAASTPEQWIANHIFADPDDATSASPMDAQSHYPASFLSLPGQNGNNSHVIVGIDGKALNPDGPGADFAIVGMNDLNEKANIYVSTNTLDTSDPAFNPDDWNFVFVGQITEMAGGGLAFNDFDLAGLGLTDAVQAIKIEGIDMIGSSSGFDLSGVLYSEGSLTDPGPLGVPEPASMILLGIGALGLLHFRRRRRRR